MLCVSLSAIGWGSSKDGKRLEQTTDTYCPTRILMDKTSWETRNPKKIAINGKLQMGYELYIETGDPFFSD